MGKSGSCLSNLTSMHLVNDWLHRQDNHHKQTMIDEKEVCWVDRTCSLDLSEVAECAVEPIEHVSADVEDVIVEAESLDPSIMWMPYDLYFQFS